MIGLDQRTVARAENGDFSFLLASLISSRRGLLVYYERALLARYIQGMCNTSR